MLRDLLVHVEGGERGRQRTKFAVDLAARTGARLSGLHVTAPPDIPTHYKPSEVEGAVAHVKVLLAADALAATAVFKEEAIDRLENACWFEAEGNVAEGISKRARYADLVIVGREEWQDPPEYHALPVGHSVVLGCGRPVLVVPTGVESAHLGKIAIAWDGSREAVRAVHDALPALMLAQAVHLIAMINPSLSESDVDVDSMITHLANHGVVVESTVAKVSGANEHKALRRKIAEGGYDLLVMGGYSHPMWLEYIFGGATQSALLSSDIPILISH